MPRCKKRRCCRRLDGEKIFKPVGIPFKQLEKIVVELDEFEAIRLCDLEGKNQIEAGKEMEISRGTVQRLLQSGRKKIVSALLNSNAITIKNKQEEKS